LAWELDHCISYRRIVVGQDRRLGKVQGARNTSTEQKGREEQTRLIDLDDSVGANYCP
jgi:hypothetical protein